MIAVRLFLQIYFAPLYPLILNYEGLVAIFLGGFSNNRK